MSLSVNWLNNLIVGRILRCEWKMHSKYEYCGEDCSRDEEKVVDFVDDFAPLFLVTVFRLSVQ